MLALGPTRALRGLLLLAALANAACSQERPRDLRPCPTVHFELCDLLKAECQAKVYHHSECARSFEGDGMPPVQTITREDYRAQLTAPRQNAATPKKQRQDRIVTKAFTLLGLLEPTVKSHEQSDIELQVNSTLAYYSITQKEVTLIDHHRQSNDAQRRRDQLVLAHEFTHAQQDEAHDLQAFYEQDFDGSTDGYYAWRSLLEAEANLSEDLVATLDPKLVLSQERLRSRLLAINLRQHAYATQSKYPYTVSLRNFPYSIAYAHVAEHYLRYGIDAVNALYKNPRTTMLDFMRPPEAPKVERIKLGFERPSDLVNQDLGSGLLDRMGAWVFYTALARNGIETSMALLYAMAWRGDALALHADASGDHVAAMWRIALPALSATTREKIASHLQIHSAKGSGASRCFVEQDEIVWVLTQVPEEIDKWEREAKRQVSQKFYGAQAPRLRPIPREFFEGTDPALQKQRCLRSAMLHP